MGEIQWSFLFLSIKNFKNSISKNIPPKVTIAACVSCKCLTYSSGFANAIFITSTSEICANIATIKTGNKNLIPKTAMNMPHVKNRLRQTLLIFSSLCAFTTALSNEIATSKREIANVVSIKATPDAPTDSPLQNARQSPIITQKIEPLKFFSIFIYVLILK